MKKSKVFILLLICILGALMLSSCGMIDNIFSKTEEAKKLNTPNGLHIEGDYLYWNAVENSNGYTVKIDETNYTTYRTQYDLYNLSAGSHNIKICAIGDGEKYTNSDFSASFVFTSTVKISEICDIRVNNEKPDFYDEFTVYSGSTNVISFSTSPTNAAPFDTSYYLKTNCNYARINSQGTLFIDANAPNNAVIEIQVSAGRINEIIRVRIVKQYLIQFETNRQDISVSDQIINHGEKAIIPSISIPEGKIFAGWYTNQNFSNDALFDFENTKISNNLKLYAKWLTQSFKVTFVTNYADLPPITKNIEYGDLTPVLSSIQPDGYIFLSAYTDSNYSIFYDYSEPVKEHKTIYIRAEKQKYTVSFETFGAEEIAPVFDVEYGNTIQEPITPRKDGFVFLGWFSDQNYTEKFDFSNQKITSATTLYARWGDEIITINFQTNGAPHIDDIKIDNGSQIGNLPTPRIPGYAFSSWHTSGSLSAETKVNRFSTFFVNTTLYAKYIKIDFDPNGGNIVKDTDAAYIMFETFGELPEVSCEGAVFEGWYTSPGGKGTRITPNTIVDFEKNIVIYANWTPNQYTIVFSENTPEYASKPKQNMSPCVYEFDFGKKGALLPKNLFTINGWTFKGWSTEHNGEVVFADKAELFNFKKYDSGTITLYAVWEVDPYLVGKYVENGTVVKDTHEKNTYTVYNYINETPHLRREGKVIVDWSRCSDGVHDFIKAVTSGGSRYDGGNTNLDISNSVTDVYFVGNPDSTYTNLHIFTVDFSVGAELTIHLNNMNMSADNGVINSWYGSESKDIGMFLTLDCIGENTIISSSSQGYAIDNRKNLIVTGGGSLTIIGGNGENGNNNQLDGKNGGTALNIDALTVDMTGRLTIIGGNGGHGATGHHGEDGITDENSKFSHYEYKLGIEVRKIFQYDRATNGSNGGKGGNGGNGGIPINCKKLDVVRGSVNLIYGDGGNGGNGGNGGKGGNGMDYYAEGYKVAYLFVYLPAQGGDGGNGGVGGNAGHSAIQDINCIFEGKKPTITAGKNGEAGRGGEAGMAGRGGAGGSKSHGGTGHSAGAAYPGTAGIRGEDGKS